MATAFFRTVILYLLLIAGLRLSGKRQIGELEPIELVLTLLISDLASVPMQDFALPLFNGVIPIITLIALSTLFSAISLRNVRFRDLVCGQPALVIVDGKLRQETMRRNRLTLDELFEQLRGQGITDLSDVKYAVLETNGRLSVLPRSPLQPVTPEQLGLDVQDNVFLPIILINDGRVLTDNLRQAGRDDRWLAQELHRQGIARALFSAVRDFCRTDPAVSRITVNSSPYAVEIYRRLGFTATDAERVTDGIRFTPMTYLL